MLSLVSRVLRNISHEHRRWYGGTSQTAASHPRVISFAFVLCFLQLSPTSRSSFLILIWFWKKYLIKMYEFCLYDAYVNLEKILYLLQVLFWIAGAALGMSTLEINTTLNNTNYSFLPKVFFFLTRFTHCQCFCV